MEYYPNGNNFTLALQVLLVPNIMPGLDTTDTSIPEKLKTTCPVFVFSLQKGHTPWEVFRYFFHFLTTYLFALNTAGA